MMNILKRSRTEREEPPFSVAELGDAIESELNNMIKRQPPQQDELPVPKYVQHNPDANEIGRLSAGALATEYEKTAKSIEALAAELVTMEKRCSQDALSVIREYEAVIERIQSAVADCHLTAGTYRERAAAIFKDIQNAQIVAEDVRRVCSQLQQRVASGQPVIATTETEQTNEKTGTTA